jgi:hypothetical protein
MTNSPSSWGSKDEDIPKTEITQHLITPAPFIAEGEVAFKNDTKVVLNVASEATQIFYNLDASAYTKYTEPFLLSEDATLKTYAEKDGVKSAQLTTQFYKIDPNLSIKLETEYANQYNAGGNNALIDGIRGTRDFRTGSWQGYQNKDVIAIVDLGSIKPIETITVNFLQDQGSWIFYPTEVECYIATENTLFKSLPAQKIDAEVRSEEASLKSIQFKMKGYSSRYIKIVAKNLGDLPAWHLGAPFNGKAWIFIDEIEVK